MQLMAEALRAKGYSAQAVAFNQDFRHYSNDRSISTQKIPFARFVFALKAIFKYDVFHFFWGVSLLDFWKFHGIDLPLLSLFNKKIIVHFRGTDLVDVNYYDYLEKKAKGIECVEPAKSRPDQLRKLEVWRKYADHLLVSTPDLLTIVPEAKLVPQVVDMDLFVKFRTPLQNQRFRIGHAPTRRGTKGTGFILEVVSQLENKGYAIELDLIENELPENVLKRFAACDVGIDQLLIGWYGKVSVELMAMGKPAICFIEDRLKVFRKDLPLVQANFKDLYVVLEKLILDRSLIKQIGEQSIIYSTKYHDVNKIVIELVDFYGD